MGDAGRRPDRAAVTIYDVAAAAGVSASTVSRALNGRGRIPPTTVDRVRAVAADLGFRFNPAARALLTGRTSTIGLVVADIANPIVSGIIRGAERAAAAAGFTLIVAESQESGAAEATTARSLMRSVDGLVLAMTWLDDDEVRALAAEKPLVLVNRAIPGIDGSVPDVRPGIEQLLDHLVRRGHRRLAYVHGPDRSWMNAQRATALREGIDQRGLSLVEIPGSEPSIEGGVDAFAAVRHADVTAALAYNDLMAFGLLRAARTAGVVVPEQLAVTGFDAMFGGELTTPQLTTVATPLEAIAARAVETLLTAGVAPDAEPLATSLVVRGTS